MGRFPILHPILFAGFPVLFLISNNVELVSVTGTPLAVLAVALVLSVLYWTILRVLLRDGKRAGLIATLSLLLFFSYGHVFEFVSGALAVRYQEGLVNLRHRHLLLIWGGLFVTLAYLSLKTKRDLSNPTLVLNAMASSLVVISLLNIGGYELASLGSRRGTSEHSRDEMGLIEGRPLPDIYYIVLDGYASSRTLEEMFHHSNDAFIRELEERGFFVARESRSNYALTFLSLASSLNMAYVNSLSEVVGVESNDLSVPDQMIEDNGVMRFLKSRGYRFIFIGSGYGVTDKNQFADWDVECGFVNEFLGIFIQSTMMRALEARFGIVANDERARRLCMFATLAEVHELEGQKLIIAHVLAPHPPYYFDANGDPVPGLVLSNSEWTPPENYVGQLLFVNKQVLRIVDAILSGSEPAPIIVLQADHGPASTFTSGADWELPSQQMLMERMHIFNAYLLPGGGNKVLYDSVTPINTFRLIFNFYFNADLETLEDESYYSWYTRPYQFTDVTARISTP